MAGADDEIEGLADSIGANPLAASVLCQLLRGSGDLDVGAGLLVESLAYATLQAGPEFATWLAGRRAASSPSVGSRPTLTVDREGERLTVRLDRPDVVMKVLVRQDGQVVAVEVLGKRLPIEAHAGRDSQLLLGPGVHDHQFLARENVEVIAVGLDDIAFVDAGHLRVGFGMVVFCNPSSAPFGFV